MTFDPLSELLHKRLSGEQGSLPDDPNSRERLPILWSFLTRRDVDGKLAKEPASISIRLGLGQWLVTLTDQSLEVSMTAVVPVLSQALELLEEAVSKPSAPWQPWKRSKGKFERVSSRSPGQEERNGDK